MVSGSWLIQRIEYASRIDKNAPEKGRVLRGVVAEILGYRQQWTASGQVASQTYRALPAPPRLSA